MQRGGSDSLLSGAAFKAECKYNLDDRYKIIPIDDKLEEGDRVFMKMGDIHTITDTPPSKKITLVIHNTDETFDDNMMEEVKPYVVGVYAVNCSAKDAKQIPLGFRDDQYTPHKVLHDVLNDTSKSSEKEILCFVNFNLDTNGGERTTAMNYFKEKPWATLNEAYMKMKGHNAISYHAPKIQDMRVEFYTTLKKTKFVICPPGNGRDTHRVYETLFYGAVPVIKTSFLDPLYEKLGGCWIVKEWDEVTEESLNEKWETISHSKVDLDIKRWLE